MVLKLIYGRRSLFSSAVSHCHDNRFSSLIGEPHRVEEFSSQLMRTGYQVLWIFFPRYKVSNFLLGW